MVQIYSIVADHRPPYLIISNIGSKTSNLYTLLLINSTDIYMYDRQLCPKKVILVKKAVIRIPIYSSSPRTFVK